MDWQLVVTMVIVASAAAYVLWRAYRRGRGRPVSACAACQGCELVAGPGNSRPVATRHRLSGDSVPGRCPAEDNARHD